MLRYVALVCMCIAITGCLDSTPPGVAAHDNVKRGLSVDDLVGAGFRLAQQEGDEWMDMPATERQYAVDCMFPCTTYTYEKLTSHSALGEIRLQMLDGSSIDCRWHIANPGTFLFEHDGHFYIKRFDDQVERAVTLSARLEECRRMARDPRRT